MDKYTEQELMAALQVVRDLYDECADAKQRQHLMAVRKMLAWEVEQAEHRRVMGMAEVN